MTRAELAERLKEKGRGYWLTSLAILALTIIGRSTIDHRLNLDDLKDAVYVVLSKSATNPAVPRHVRIVWMGDREFWGPALDHRSPTNRAYLARLVKAADAADAGVIALDFDMELPGLTSSVKPGDFSEIEPAYRPETDALIQAIDEVAQRRHVVLAKSMTGPTDGPFTLVDDAYQAYGLCTTLLPDGRWRSPGTPAFPVSPAAERNISCAYINLMDDARQVPPPARLTGRTERLDAFPLAIARARDPAAPDRIEGGRFFASYIPEKVFMSPGSSLPAAQLLHDPAGATGSLQGYAVMIGANWHVRGPGQGDRVDLHQTPVGPTVGALIHANLAEAVLSGRVYPALSEEIVIGIEIVLGIGAAMLFALVASPGLATALLLLTMPLLLLIQWTFLQLFGAYLDLFAPVVGLGVHAILDRLINGSEVPKSKHNV